jgi:predicted transcriptional regulator
MAISVSEILQSIETSSTISGFVKVFNETISVQTFRFASIGIRMVVTESVNISTSFVKNLNDGLVKYTKDAGTFVYDNSIGRFAKGKIVTTHNRDDETDANDREGNGNTYKRSGSI